MDGADEAAALGVLGDDAEARAVEHGGVAVDVGDGEVDGGGGRPPDDGVEGEERADGHVARPRRRDGQRHHAAEAEHPEKKKKQIGHLFFRLERRKELVNLSPERWVDGGGRRSQQERHSAEQPRKG